MKASGVVEDASLGIIDADGRRNQMQLLPGHLSWLKKSDSAKGAQG
jgi:hypothetical protein